MILLEQLISYLISLSQKIPVELFVVFGSFIEEIIAPIPSPVVMTTAGAIAQAQAKPFYFIAVLALFGSASKTFGAWLWYYFSNKAGDVVINKTKKFTGVSNKEITTIRKYLSGGSKDFFIIIALRAIPAIPTAPVSLAAGILKLNQRPYLLATFIGNFIRDCIFLYLGYSGLHTAERLMAGISNAETIVELLIGIILFVVICWLYYRRMKARNK